MTNPDPTTDATPISGPDAAPLPGANPPPGATPLGAAPPPPGAPPAWGQPAPWPERREPQAPGLVLGIILVVVGVSVLALRVAEVWVGPNPWTLWLVVPGVAMVAASLAIPTRGGLGLAIPGAMLAIVGLILYVQDTWGGYGTWAYAWALVAPTGPGLAMLFYGGLKGDRELAREGLRVTLVGIGLFLGFALFFEGVIGISGHRIEHLDQVLPYAAIGLGVLLIVLAVVDGGHRDAYRDQRRAERQAAKELRRAERAARRAAR